MEIHFLVMEKSWQIIVEKEWSPCIDKYTRIDRSGMNVPNTMLFSPVNVGCLTSGNDIL